MKKFKQLLLACKQDRVDSSFKVNRYWPIESVTPDDNEWQMVERFLPGSGTLYQGLRWLKELAESGEKIRQPAGLRRPMEYISSHPDVQLAHRVILPLPMWHWGCYLLPIFSRCREKRCIEVHLIDIKRFDRHCGWLVLSRK